MGAAACCGDANSATFIAQHLARIAEQVEKNAKKLRRIGVDFKNVFHVVMDQDVVFSIQRGLARLFDNRLEPHHAPLRRVLVGPSVAQRIG
ncbi:MAG TPA: hypothetical protein VIJ85_09385, partial [Rhizomicrobium sp.]